jgi:hypothetical protein
MTCMSRSAEENSDVPQKASQELLLRRDIIDILPPCMLCFVHSTDTRYHYLAELLMFAKQTEE